MSGDPHGDVMQGAVPDETPSAVPDATAESPPRRPGWRAELEPLVYEPMVRRALEEDLGLAGDVTTAAVVPPDATSAATIVAREGGRVAGMDVAAATFRLYDDRMRWLALVADGDDAAPGDPLATIEGPARGLLTAERVALNFLGHMSGIATVTRDMVAAVRPHPARVVGTRKTTPGIRALEKHAVRMGGGYNHRFGLDDAVLIKDNHLAIAGGVRKAVARARSAVGHMVVIEVEVDTLEQLEVALEVGVNAVLLDNMDLDTLARAVSMAHGRAITEASGGITPETAAAVAATGVDLLSVGWLTHSAPNLDVGLDIGG